MRKVSNMAASASGKVTGSGHVSVSGPKATVEIKAFREGSVIPKKATESAAGYDLCAWAKDSFEETFLIPPHTVMVVPTGLNVNIPNGYEIQIRPRSGMAAKHCVTVLNTPGTIDAGFRGEIACILINHDAKESISFKKGDRIAQLVIQQVEKAEFIEVEELPGSGRGSGGFGSTGVA